MNLDIYHGLILPVDHGTQVQYLIVQPLTVVAARWTGLTDMERV